MLDKKFVLANTDAIKKNCLDRGMTVDIERFVELEQERRELQDAIEELNQQANAISKTIGKAKDDAERQERIAEGKSLRGSVATKKEELTKLTDELDVIHAQIPNMAHADAPIGKDDKANLEIRRGETPIPSFDFTPLDHVALAEKHDLIDFEGGSQVAGHGFYYLKNDLVFLEMALVQYALQFLRDEGFTPLTTPDLARNEILAGIGFNPRGNETNIYSVENSDLSLVATAEITLGGMLAGKTLDKEEMPLRFCGLSHCFRTEAGAHGKATRGIYRVHQFTKLEMFVYSLAEQSDAILEELCTIEQRIFDSLGIPYRVVDTATGDLGAPAYRKYDLEAWMPGRGEGGEFGEVTSTSNCTDYQARRLNIRYRTKGEKGTKFLHTLNGTAVATTRAIIAILENYQQADGSILIPPVLQKWVGKEKIG